MTLELLLFLKFWRKKKLPAYPQCMKYSCVFRVVKLHLAVTCELDLKLLQIHEDVFGPFVSVQPRVAALEKDAVSGDGGMVLG